MRCTIEPLELSSLMPSTSQRHSYALWCEYCAKVWHRSVNLNHEDKRSYIFPVPCLEHKGERWAGACIPIHSFLLSTTADLFRDYAREDIAQSIAAWIGNRQHD
jgi:hypothetical protein